MTRGIRGATTVTKNNELDIVNSTQTLLEEMISKNKVTMESISHIIISATKDIDAVFPAKALRKIKGSTYVPIMCMTEIDVPNSLPKCIRIMMVVNTTINQKEIHHIFHNEAIQLRPDLTEQAGG